MKNLYVLHSDALNYSDPHGYVIRSKMNSKRVFLKECIKRIYAISNNVMPSIETPVEYNKNVIWETINRVIMATPVMTNHAAKVEKVKRRLFVESKERKRKLRKPNRSETLFCECSFFKAKRHMWGRKKIPRNYLGRARLFIEMELCQNRKRKYKEIEAEGDDEENSMDSEDSQQANMCHQHLEIEPYHLSQRAHIMEETIMMDEYAQRSLATEKVLEESIRSILYMQALQQLITDDPNNDELYE